MFSVLFSYHFYAIVCVKAFLDYYLWRIYFLVNNWLSSTNHWCKNETSYDFYSVEVEEENEKLLESSINHFLMNLFRDLHQWSFGCFLFCVSLRRKSFFALNIVFFTLNIVYRLNIYLNIVRSRATWYFLHVRI